MNQFLKIVLKLACIVGLVVLFGFSCFCMWYIWAGFFSRLALLYILPSLVLIAICIPFLFLMFKYAVPQINRTKAVLIFLLSAFLLIPIGEFTGVSRFIEDTWSYYVTFQGKITYVSSQGNITNMNFRQYWEQEKCSTKLANDPRTKDKEFFEEHRHDCDVP